MSLLAGINHTAIVTADLDRWLEFYEGVFEAEVVFREATPAFRHAILKVGAGAMLHPVEAAGSPHAVGAPEALARGHLDHLGLGVSSGVALEEIRQRLVRRGASDGVVLDLGPQLNVSFVDPDGMQAEVCWIRDPRLQGFHAPRVTAPSP